MLVGVVASITGILSYFHVNKSGFTKEIKRNVRDIGSNVVILPKDVDQVSYHEQGGYSEVTMPELVVEQLLAHKASLNHLIPMLERKEEVSHDGRKNPARIVGISASIPMPGRPKAPMQKALKEGMVQVGSSLAQKLSIDRDNPGSLEITGQTFQVERVNKASGTWQDGVVFIDLKAAQKLFQQEGQISRIEAIECTSEKCEELGVTPNVVLTNELVSITDQAQILRRSEMANARTAIRNMSSANLSLLSNVLWVFLVVTILLLTLWNTTQRKSEIGVFRAIGFGQGKIVRTFLARSLYLAIAGAVVGVMTGSLFSFFQMQSAFSVTGKKVSIDWMAGCTIGGLAIMLAILAAAIPSMIAASKHPADIIGKDSV